LLTCVCFVIVCFVKDLYLCEVHYLFFGGNSFLFMDFLSVLLPAIASLLPTHFVPEILHDVVFSGMSKQDPVAVSLWSRAPQTSRIGSKSDSPRGGHRLHHGQQTDPQRHPDMPNQQTERRRAILDFEVILQFRSRSISLFL